MLVREGKERGENERRWGEKVSDGGEGRRSGWRDSVNNPSQ